MEDTRSVSPMSPCLLIARLFERIAYHAWMLLQNAAACKGYVLLGAVLVLR